MDDGRLYFASIIFVPFSEEKLQEPGIVDVILSFNNDCDRQQNQSDFQMVCYDSLFLFGAENCVSISFGNGVKLEFGGNAL